MLGHLLERRIWFHHSVFALETGQSSLAWVEIKARLRCSRKCSLSAHNFILHTNYITLLYVKLYYKINPTMIVILYFYKRKRLEEIQVTSSNLFILRALK